MKRIAIADLSTELLNLLDDVARGEEVTFLRDGKPVARIVATEERPTLTSEFSPEETARRRDIVKRLRENARQIGLKATQEEIKSWIEEGRH